MSDGIEVKAGIKTQTVAQNPDLPIKTAKLPHNDSTAGGSENGGIYFELNLRNGRGRERQQNLLTTFSGENPNEPISADDENSDGPIFYAGNSARQNRYENTSAEPTFYNTNHSNGNNYGITRSNGNLSDDLPDLRELSLDDFVELVENNEGFAALRNQPREFRYDVRHFPESKNIEPEGENLPNVFDDSVDVLERNEGNLKFPDKEVGVGFFDKNDENSALTFDKKLRKNAPPDISEYEQLIAEMNAKKLSPDEFAETLPPNDREVFKALYQLDVTFGTKVFTGDDVNTVQTAVLPKELRVFTREDTNVLVENTPTSRDAAVGAENAVPFGANTFIESEPGNIESNDLRFHDKSSQVAVGGNTNPILNESGAARIINHNSISENSSNISAVARRDGGAALGGALISGAFTSIENYKNAESRQISGSHSIGNTDVYGRSVFSAGATGVMMSAAIGSVIPNSEATVSGVLGFISSVVVGVEAEQGLRWLGGDRPTTIAPSNNTENLLTATLNLRPLLA